jgi:hypothetical protein
LDVYQQLLDKKFITEKEYVDKKAELKQKETALVQAEANAEIGFISKVIANLKDGIKSILFGITKYTSEQAKIADAIALTLNTIRNAVNTAEQAYFDNQKKRVDQQKQDSLDRIGLLEKEELATAQSESQKVAIQAKYDKQRAEAEKKAAEQKKKLALKQITVDYAVAVIKTMATFGFPLGLLPAAALTLQYIAERAAVNAQTFATGGRVHPLRNGKISASQNIPTQPNGDRVLATVRPGEVILNESQQKLLGGHRTFRSIGVPGFASGGITGGYPGSSLQAPVFTPASNNVYVQNNTDFTELIGEVRQLRTETIRNHQATSKRIDKLQVYQVTSSVTSAQKKEAKQTKIGSF